VGVGGNEGRSGESECRDLFLYGEKDADKIFALAGNDTVFPRGGNDIVTLGAGKDTVVFDTKLSAVGNKDLITDFSHFFDTIKLDHTIFGKLGIGTLKAANFHVGAHAGDSNDYTVYNQQTGALFYDSNGSGSGHEVQFATLGTFVHPAIANNDFVVVAWGRTPAGLDVALAAPLVGRAIACGDGAAICVALTSKLAEACEGKRPGSSECL